MLIGMVTVKYVENKQEINAYVSPILSRADDGSIPGELMSGLILDTPEDEPSPMSDENFMRQAHIRLEGEL